MFSSIAVLECPFCINPCTVLVKMNGRNGIELVVTIMFDFREEHDSMPWIRVMPLMMPQINDT